MILTNKSASAQPRILAAKAETHLALRITPTPWPNYIVVRSLTRSPGPKSSPSKSESQPRALSAIQLDPSSEEAVDLSYASQDDLVDGSGHRPLEQTPTKYIGLVTKVIHARSPDFHSKRG